MKRTMRSGSGNGAGLSRTEFTTEKIAVLVPMPRVKGSTAASGESGTLAEDAQRVLQVLDEEFPWTFRRRIFTVVPYISRGEGKW